MRSIFDATFQPSHIFRFTIPANEDMIFYEDVRGASLLLRGDFFVTSGGDYKVDFSVRLHTHSLPIQVAPEC